MSPQINRQIDLQKSHNWVLRQFFCPEISFNFSPFNVFKETFPESFCAETEKELWCENRHTVPSERWESVRGVSHGGAAAATAGQLRRWKPNSRKLQMHNSPARDFLSPPSPTVSWPQSFFHQLPFSSNLVYSYCTVRRVSLLAIQNGGTADVQRKYNIRLNLNY